MPSTRRTTLGPVSTNRRVTMCPSAIDSATKKPKSRTRKSMAPRVNSGESHLNPKSPGIKPRNTPSKPRITPSKHKSGGRKSLAPPHMATKADPRPISDRSYRESCIDALVNFLTSHEYDHPISHKSLRCPSGKDFNQIVTFLFRMIDPAFNDGHMKFEDEVSQWFKSLGYPFTVSKTALVAAGSPATWPTLLAALTWLIEKLSCNEMDLVDEDFSMDRDGNDGGEDALNSVEDLIVKGDRDFFNYVAESYEAFLSADDARYDALEEEWVLQLEKDSLIIEKEIEGITDKNAAIVEEIDSLGHRVEDLPGLEKKREDIASELEKFHELVQRLNEHKAKLNEQVKERKAELDLSESELEKKKMEIKKLEEIIGSQKLSVDDVRRMETEKSRAKESIERAAALKKEYNKTLWESERELDRRLEQLEEIVSKYNARASELLLIPETAPNARGKNFMIKVQKEHAEDRYRSHLLGGVDVEGMVSPSIRHLKGSYSDRTDQARREILDLLDREEASNEQLAETTDKSEMLAEKIKKNEEIITKEKKEHGVSLSVRLKEIELLETKISSIRDPMALEAAITKYQKQCAQLEALRRQHHEKNVAKKKAVQQEINEAIRACADHKEYTQRRLNQLSLHVQEQANRFDRIKHCS